MRDGLPAGSADASPAGSAGRRPEPDPAVGRLA
jgi:hypothetical protein